MDDRVYLLHIRDSIRKIVEYTLAGKEAFFADAKTQDAVLRNLEVIGEAVKNLSLEFRSSNPEIAWKQVAGMRDLLIHHYFGVKLETVWNVVEMELPKLRAVVERTLDET